MADWVQFVIIVGAVALVIGSLGLWSLFRKTPMHFWAGDIVKPETITDIPKYNKENAIMWFCYCIPLVVSLIIAPYSVGIAAILMSVCVVGGIPIIIIVYQRIFAKYRK